MTLHYLIMHLIKITTAATYTYQKVCIFYLKNNDKICFYNITMLRSGKKTSMVKKNIW